MLLKARRIILGTTMAMLAAVPLSAETLGDALVAAYRNSNLLEQNRALLRAADEGVARAVAALRPTLDFVATAGWSNSERVATTAPFLRSSPEITSATASLTAGLLIYDGGARQLGVAAAKETVLATRQALIGIEHQVLMGAVDAYMSLRLAQDVVALRQGNLRVLSRELEAARDRFELGEITRTDVAIAEARLAAARAQLAAAQGEVAVGRETYNLAVGRAPGALANPPRPPVTARTLEEAKRIARTQHFNIRAAQHNVTAAELEVQVTQAGLGPSLSASVTLGTDSNGLTDRSIGLRANQSLYAGGGKAAALRATMARRDATRSQLHHTVAQVDQAVGQAWAQRAVARASIEASDRQITAAQAAYDGVREEATLGARTTIDVLNAEQELLNARAQRLQAVTSEYVSNYALLAAMGYLTVDHLKLGIPTYDVTGYYNAVKNAPAASARGQRLDRILQSRGVR